MLLDTGTYKYNIELYDLIMASFDHLPIAAIVNKAFFCVHGGLSPDISTVHLPILLVPGLLFSLFALVHADPRVCNWMSALMVLTSCPVLGKSQLEEIRSLDRHIEIPREGPMWYAIYAHSFGRFIAFSYLA